LEDYNSDTETKMGVIVAVVMVITALYNLKIAAAIATVYLVLYGILRLRKERVNKPKENTPESDAKRKFPRKRSYKELQHIPIMIMAFFTC
jgi:prolipoprotein diacylglyceryltransferase